MCVELHGSIEEAVSVSSDCLVIERLCEIAKNRLSVSCLAIEGIIGLDVLTSQRITSQSHKGCCRQSSVSVAGDLRRIGLGCHGADCSYTG